MARNLFKGHLFRSTGRAIRVEPIHRHNMDGSTTISMGFVLCEVSEGVESPKRIARAIAAALNAAAQDE